MSDWKPLGSLNRDPFDARRSAFVETPGHVEAVARLVHTIETAGRSARLVAAPGLGKTRVLTRALELSRSPERRIARICGAIDGADLFARLAISLGVNVAPSVSRSAAWRALVEAARLCRWQGLQVVLAVDDCQTLSSNHDRMDLDRLDEIDPDSSTRLTVLRVGRRSELENLDEERAGVFGEWSLSARLFPLTRSETGEYLAAKLESAGRAEPTFTPRAISRLHSATGGVPRGIDRIASLALLASSYRGLEMVTPDIVEEVAGECLAVEATSLDG